MRIEALWKIFPKNRLIHDVSGSVTTVGPLGHSKRLFAEILQLLWLTRRNLNGKLNQGEQLRREVFKFFPEIARYFS